MNVGIKDSVTWTIVESQYFCVQETDALLYVHTFSSEYGSLTVTTQLLSRKDFFIHQMLWWHPIRMSYLEQKTIIQKIKMITKLNTPIIFFYTYANISSLRKRKMHVKYE